MGDRELLTIKQAAEDLGVSVMSVRRYIDAGRLTPYKPGRELFFWSDELERFKKTRRAPGRPKGSKNKPRKPVEYARTDCRPAAESRVSYDARPQP